MIVKQVSVFVENQKGRLVAMLEVLKANNINMHALSVAETTDFGIVRMILSDSDKGVEVLKKANFTVKETDVLQREMPDIPGGLLETIAKPLNEAGINLEYFYAFIDPAPGKATIVVKVDNPKKAEEILDK
ncbi:MAG: amino acid-binding protein [Dehalococcoidales bacterium]|nr:amino acid-binding protein [Dehalococcoidales bacterium]